MSSAVAIAVSELPRQQLIRSLNCPIRSSNDMISAITTCCQTSTSTEIFLFLCLDFAPLTSLPYGHTDWVGEANALCRASLRHPWPDSHYIAQKGEAYLWRAKSERIRFHHKRFELSTARGLDWLRRPIPRSWTARDPGGGSACPTF